MPEVNVCLLVLLGASLIGGISGFGFTLLALTVFSFLIDIKTAVAFLSIHTLGHNIIQVARLRKHIAPRRTLPLILGGILGVPAGVLFLARVDVFWVEKILGLIVLFVVAQAVWQAVHNLRRSKTESHALAADAERVQGGRNASRHPEHKSDRLRLVRGSLFGISAGSLMGAYFSGCPLAVIYSVGEGGDKYAVKATLQSFFLFSSAYGVVLYSLTGLLTTPVFLNSVLLLPATAVGTVLGMYIFERISNELFHRVVLVFLALTGLSLLMK